MTQSRKTAVSRKVRRVNARAQPGKILDLFAGAGGWEEGLGMLGLSALGIETERWARETARAAGHERVQADVAALDPLGFRPVWGLVGSPPCQAYSNAGKGLGRADKPLVIACAHELAAGNDSRRAWREGCRDERSLLTVEPLRFALALRPRWVALEQVPAVLELWVLFAGLLSAHGYQVAVGVLSAECYGVPQTRKRAFLIASLDGPVSLPDATHRAYDPRRRQEVPRDELGLKPWVSMAEALGWTPSEEVGLPRRNENLSNRPISAEAGIYRECGRRPACKPARLTTKVNRWRRAHGVGDGWAWRNGNQPNAAVRPSEEPAPTVHFGHALNQVEWVPAWAGRRPATTVACDRRVHPPGHKQNASDPPGRYEQRGGANAVRVTVCQAAILQGFRADYPWRGTRTRQFEQVGNAVPPPLARRVLEQAIHSKAKTTSRALTRRRVR